VNDSLKETFNYIKNLNLDIIDKDLFRPWGGFFVINEIETYDFINIFFKELKKNEIKFLDRLSPKILVILPEKRLSWSYHNRREEIWKVIKGKINVIISSDNIQRKKIELKKGDSIKINKRERHRIIGKSDFAVVAELWIHTDKNNPSDEYDIVRIQDDFNR
tara:strand:+ start:80 stop:565 length:486 start_codon:yes stop_codon:yes gene_type:complete